MSPQQSATAGKRFYADFVGITYSRSPGTHIVGPWVPDSIKLQRDLRTGTQYIGNWASRVRQEVVSKLSNNCKDAWPAVIRIQGTSLGPCWPGILS